LERSIATRSISHGKSSVSEKKEANGAVEYGRWRASDGTNIESGAVQTFRRSVGLILASGAKGKGRAGGGERGETAGIAARKGKDTVGEGASEMETSFTGTGAADAS
jgi:hypothetical protein